MAVDPAVSATYPRSLGAERCDPCVFDVPHYEQLLNENSDRLFVADSEIRAKVIGDGVEDHVLRDLDDVEKYLESCPLRSGGLRTILIPQRFSWDHLMVSDSAFRRLSHHFRIFPAFLDVVQSFGKQTSSKSDAASCHRFYTRAGVSEFCSLVKIAEEHGREDAAEPWSIRQMGFYAQHDAQSGSSTVIILNPSQTFQHRLKEARSRTTAPLSLGDLLTLVLSCATTTWRGYAGYLDSRLARLATMAHLSSVTQLGQSSGQQPEVRVDFGDIQDIRVLQDILEHVQHMLQSNKKTCTEVARFMEGSEKPSNQAPTYTSGMTLCTDMTTVELDHVWTMMRRTQAASDLMQNIISFRSLEALNTSSSKSSEMARLAQSDNKLMLDLAAKSRKDAQTLKTITILTMVYLPVAFVSQFLSMGYLNLNYQNHQVTLHFAGEMWVFVILSVILLCMTIGSWLWLERRRRRRLRELNKLLDSEAHPGAEKT